MKTDISDPFQSIVRRAYEGIEFNLVAGCRPEGFIELLVNDGVTAVAQWLRCCATNRKVAGSIPDGVIGIFH